MAFGDSAERSFLEVPKLHRDSHFDPRLPVYGTGVST